MEKPILFSERQRFRQWWLWVILFGVNALFLYGVFQQLVRKHPFGDDPISDAGLLIISGLVLAGSGLLACSTMETRIQADGIYIKFFPFHWSFRHYPWPSISRAFIRQYSAIADYGGWGIRFGIFGKGKAFNVSGNKGLQLEFDDKRKLLIGTRRPEELQETLIRLGQLKK
jgi:hypothetical protein